MKHEAAALAAKAIATAGAAIAVFGLTWWAIAAALIGATASFYFEPEQVPKGALKLVFGIVAMGFAAAFMAVAMPSFPLLGRSAEVPLEVRAGLLGLTIRWLVEQGKLIGATWAARRS